MAAAADLPLSDYLPFHVTRAELPARAGHPDEAAAAYRRALELAETPPSATS